MPLPMETCRLPIPKDLPAGASRPILPVKRFNEVIGYATARDESYEFALDAKALDAINSGELTVEFQYVGDIPIALMIVGGR